MTSESRYAGVLATHGGQVVLVYEKYSTWDRHCWNIPSGRIEDDELPAADRPPVVTPPTT